MKILIFTYENNNSLKEKVLNLYLQLVVSVKRRKDWSLDNCTPFGKAKPSNTTWVVLVGGSYLRSLPVASPSNIIKKWFLQLKNSQLHL